MSNTLLRNLVRWNRQTTMFAAAIASLALAALYLNGQATPSSVELVPDALHGRTSTIVVDQVRSHHLLRSKVLDDVASAEIYERYLKVLDGGKRFFLQNDIDEFEKYRLHLDDALTKGDLDPAYEIFNRLQTRTVDRLNWILNRLEVGMDSFDLSTNRTLIIEPDDRSYPANEYEANELWERILISNIISAKLDEDEDEEILERFTKRYKARLRQVKQIKTDDVFTQYLNAFTKSFDPHTEYFSPRGKQEFELQMSLSMEGIGARLELIDEYVQIKELVQGGPADREGSLKPNDRIVSVGQSPTSPMIDVVGWRLDDVVDLIRGPKGTVVVLGIKTPDLMAQDSKTVQITRDTIKINELAAKKRVLELSHGERPYKVGFIELPSMYRDFTGAQRGTQNFSSATRDVKRLIEELKEEDIDALVMDLRRNGGGSLDEAVSLVGLFIQSGPTVQVRGTARRVSVLEDKDPSVTWDGPLGVLVDQYSASASEIFAGAIQDYQRGVVIGHQTFGKGTVQSLVAANRGQLKVTQAKFYRINGASTQLVGVMPDIELVSPGHFRESGERTYDGALPWDTIKPLNYMTYAANVADMETIKELHEERKAISPYFNFVGKLADRAKQEQDTNSLSLNFRTREAELEERNQWRLDVTNPYLIANGIEPVEDISELEDRMHELDDQIPEEIELEASRILLDYALLGNQHLAAVTDKEVDSTLDQSDKTISGQVQNIENTGN